MSDTLLLRMDDYTTQAKAYWWATAVLGVVALALAVTRIATLETGRDHSQVLLGTLFAAITVCFRSASRAQRLRARPRRSSSFCCFSISGPTAAAIAAAAEAGVISWRTSARWTSRLGSPAMAALAMYGVRHGVQLRASASPDRCVAASG